ncbi:dihydrofolate reductase family protein [Planococcus sp. 1R117A]|uniref:dihydrofolate reductase family protein n=1 Tax=Planococcus sp. 1R117A TaxID=3447020 RepID=UPI003EDC20A7
MVQERKVTCYIAISLDGYIATKDDSLDWLFKVEMEGDAGYAEFIETIDTVVMGRRTYDWIVEMEKGKVPYPDKKCYVFSNSKSGQAENVIFTNEDVKSFVEREKSLPGKDIWVVGGGNLLHSFLKEKLIDEFLISIAPIMIGQGIPLFQELDFETEFTLKSAQQSGQFTQMHLVRK